MKRRWLLLLAVASLLAGTAPSQERKEARTAGDAARDTPKGPDLRFTEDGKDLLVHLMIEGPAVRQVVLTDYTVYDGKPAWDEPPIGVDKPRRQPQVELRYLILVNRNLPGFVDKGLMRVPTPPEARRQQRQEVIWRLTNFRSWDFRKEDARFTVQGSRFETSAEQLRQALPRIKQAVDAWETKSTTGSPAP
jgi:hypothetical protein